MPGIFIAGAGSSTGARLADHLVAAGRFAPVIGFDLRTNGRWAPGVQAVHGDLETADLKPLLEGVDAIVHLAWSSTRPAASLHAWRRVLDGASAAGVAHVVFVSSAVVYGAWPDNPVPLTEDAPVRPTPGFADAAARAEGERIGWDWAGEHPSASLTVLRPTLVLTAGEDPWLTQVLGPPRRMPRGAPGPPRQFLHADDLVGAIAHVVEGGHGGVFNVAPDGWAPAEDTRMLGAWRPVSGEVVAGSRAYSRHPWVVANDRLRATGWMPNSSSEEAVVSTRQGVWWRELSPQRRQQLALGAVGAGIVSAALGALGVIRRRRAVR